MSLSDDELRQILDVAVYTFKHDHPAAVEIGRQAWVCVLQTGGLSLRACGRWGTVIRWTLGLAFPLALFDYWMRTPVFMAVTVHRDGEVEYLYAGMVYDSSIHRVAR